jgi:hypothetical protein
MNFAEFLAKLGSAANKTLTDAKALLVECATHLTAAVARIGEVEAANTAFQSEITTLRASLLAAEASVTTLTGEKNSLTEQLAAQSAGVISVLATAGIKVEKLDPDAIKSAANARAETLGHELLAARGMKPLPEQLKPADEVEEKNDLSSDAKILAAYEAMPTGPERVAFLTKHEQAIWRAHTSR